jgi:hypothetical protein
MEDIAKIKVRLKGSAQERKRREQLLNALAEELSARGPDGVTGELTNRFDALADQFSSKLNELYKQL